MTGGDAARPAPTFDRDAWLLDARRTVAVAAVLSYVYALAATGRPLLRLVALLQVVELAAMCLPWRLPRHERGAAGYWLESAAGLVAPVGATVAVACVAPDWARRGGAWWWYPLAVLLAAGLVAASGMRLSALRDGRLAFVLGPTPRAHGLARAATAALAPVGEEVVYRGCLLALTGAVPIGLLGAAAFVAGHHVPPGANRRGDSRSTLVEVLGAVAWLALTLASGSAWPAALSHGLVNLPAVVLELQREPEPPAERQEIR